jgi:hypothetical protein
MRGTITSGDVVRHAVTIVRCWGPRAYLRCLRAALVGRPTTFLAVLYPRSTR